MKIGDMTAESVKTGRKLHIINAVPDLKHWTQENIINFIKKIQNDDIEFGVSPKSEGIQARDIITSGLFPYLKSNDDNVTIEEIKVDFIRNNYPFWLKQYEEGKIYIENLPNYG